MADKKPSLMIALGIGKKPNSGMSAPPPKFGGGSSAAAAAPDDPKAGGGEPEPDDEDTEKKPPERAGYGGPEEICSNCENWVSPNACSKVDTVTDPNGHCYSDFEPKGGGANMGAGGMPMMPMGGGAPSGGESQGA